MYVCASLAWVSVEDQKRAWGALEQEVQMTVNYVGAWNRS